VWLFLGISVTEQFVIFLFSILMGVILGIIYSVFKVFRMIFKMSIVQVFFLDIFYFIFSSILTFLFIIAVSTGEIRLFIIAGEIAGFFIYYITLGNLLTRFIVFIMKITRKIVFKIKKIVILIIKPVKNLAKKLILIVFKRIKKCRLCIKNKKFFKIKK